MFEQPTPTPPANKILFYAQQRSGCLATNQGYYISALMYSFTSRQCFYFLHWAQRTFILPYTCFIYISEAPHSVAFSFSCPQLQLDAFPASFFALYNVLHFSRPSKLFCSLSEANIEVEFLSAEVHIKMTCRVLVGIVRQWVL